MRNIEVLNYGKLNMKVWYEYWNMEVYEKSNFYLEKVKIVPCKNVIFEISDNNLDKNNNL